MRSLVLCVVLVLGSLATPAAAGPTKAEARVAAAAAAFATASTRQQAGAAPVDTVYVWSVRWLDAQREQPLKGKALAAAAAAHLERMVALEAAVTKAVAAGAAPASDREAAAYYRAEAELWVERKGKR
ncbi:MAG: hypothetical protein JNK64_31600 [Myxococcales bacterium]|nr:hypothetical protein [Myxococcales bacterium]